MNIIKTLNLPPPPLVLVRAKEVYRVWHLHLSHVKRVDRYTIGTKIDDEFISILEIIFRATFAYDKFEKLSLVSQALGKNDLLKFFLQLGWEQKVLNHTIYGQLIILLDEVGRMLGGWKKNLQEKTPTNK
ncbi:MAG: four helix bundle protein [Candidatus Pacebacteria bacterium]|nr:four helix bundle protein [Candidatus Paceibacterota bacterium]